MQDHDGCERLGDRTNAELSFRVGLLRSALREHARLSADDLLAIDGDVNAAHELVVGMQMVHVTLDLVGAGIRLSRFLGVDRR